MKEKIKFILVKPRNRNYCSYFVNMNLKDQHSMKYEDLYLFIASMLTPPATIEVHELIYSYQNFLVDIKNNSVLPLDPQAKPIKRKILSPKKLNKVIRQIEKEQRKTLNPMLDELQIKIENLNARMLDNKKNSKDEVKKKLKIKKR